MRSHLSIIAVVLLASFAPAAAPKVPPGMKVLDGRYHTLIYDVTDDEAREVLQRMEAMVDEYLVRTRDFSGKIRSKMPFMVFRHEADYLANGGPSGTAGVFDPNKQVLMAIAGEKLSMDTWHVIQHEGFHQFAFNVIGGDLPIWVNEGLAEYFGEAVYTGDGFVSGAIPGFRLERVQDEIKSKKFISLDEMMGMSHRTWNAEMKIENYDQAWSMVQFLAHGDNGKYQKTFANYMIQVGRGIQSKRAWDSTFGSSAGFEQRWTDFWAGLPKNPTLNVYSRAATQMLASYAGRAAGQKQTFKDVDELVAAIKDSSIKIGPQDTLPKTLGEECTGLFGGLKKAGATFTLQTTPAPSAASRSPGGFVKCTLSDGATITANFRTRGTRGAMTDVKVAEATKEKSASKP